MTSLTIFTPTYNRAYTLPRLYKSLCQQTAQDFEWLVVDDGSTDETQMLFNTWLEEGKIPIRYITKENGGKPSAYNIAAKEAKGELFLCVDSDDYLVDNAVEKVLNNWETTDEYKEYDGKPVIGQLYFKGYQNNTPPATVRKHLPTSQNTEEMRSLQLY